MYIVDYRTTDPLEDRVMEECRAFLAKYAADGTFLVAGAQSRRVGGIIVVNGIDRERLIAVLAEAPFLKRGIATCTVTEFGAKHAAPVLQAVVA